MASDEISVRLDEIVESLDQVLKLTEDLPPNSAVGRVTGPAVGVTRDFKYELTAVAYLARAMAEHNKQQIRELADAVVKTVNELEAADKISASQATQLENLLTEPAIAPAPTSAAAPATPATTPTPSNPPSDGSRTAWA